MSKASDAISAYIKSKPPEEIVSKIPERTESMKRRNRLRGFKKVLDFIGGGGASSHSTPSGGTIHHPQPSASSSFRERYKEEPFDPEKWLIKERQARAYHQLIDGKGDHDCDQHHER